MKIHICRVGTIFLYRAYGIKFISADKYAVVAGNIFFRDYFDSL